MREKPTASATPLPPPIDNEAAAKAYDDHVHGHHDDDAASDEGNDDYVYV